MFIPFSIFISVKLFFGKIIFTSVSLFSIEFISIPIPNFVHSFLHKNNPIPVDFFSILPFVPVKPLSNTFGS